MPAARTGRSAKTIEFADTLVIVSLPPSSLAPAELTTKSDGTGPVGVTAPMVFFSGTFGMHVGVLRECAAECRAETAGNHNETCDILGKHG